jgi:hypothetical protein
MKGHEQRLYHDKHCEIPAKTHGGLDSALPVRDTVSTTEDVVIGTLAFTVLIFVSTDCPVSNRYAPEITRLYEEFSPKGVRFRLVYPNRLDTPEAIDAHIRTYAYPPIAERDSEHVLVNVAGATITPEAAVFDKGNRLLYLGRIDDRFVELGRERPAAVQRDLRNALTALLAGKPVSPARTQAVGCFIADMKP